MIGRPGWIVIGGIEGGKMLENACMRPPQPTDIADIENDVAACVARLRVANPDIAALLFTCTGSDNAGNPSYGGAADLRHHNHMPDDA
ncbi:hypothetical protein [Mesorhizobium sp. M0768]|uniref:hypothetical protein n=1 Tax=Mesorhizobium sp. M0768 TaxID=2956996 RepID=UPI003334E63E